MKAYDRPADFDENASLRDALEDMVEVLESLLPQLVGVHRTHAHAGAERGRRALGQAAPCQTSLIGPPEREVRLWSEILPLFRARLKNQTPFENAPGRVHNDR